MVLNYYDADPDDLTEEVKGYAEEWELWAEFGHDFNVELRDRYLRVCLGRRRAVRMWRRVRRIVATVSQEIGEHVAAHYLSCMLRGDEHLVEAWVKSAPLAALMGLLREVQLACEDLLPGGKEICSDFLERERANADANVFASMCDQLRDQEWSDTLRHGPALLVGLSLDQRVHTTLSALLTKMQMCERIGESMPLEVCIAPRRRRCV
jgi:hypothetical protein